MQARERLPKNKLRSQLVCENIRLRILFPERPGLFPRVPIKIRPIDRHIEVPHEEHPRPPLFPDLKQQRLNRGNVRLRQGCQLFGVREKGGVSDDASEDVDGLAVDLGLLLVVEVLQLALDFGEQGGLGRGDAEEVLLTDELVDIDNFVPVAVDSRVDRVVRKRAVVHLVADVGGRREG